MRTSVFWNNTSIGTAFSRNGGERLLAPSVLELSTTPQDVDILTNMNATALFSARIVYSESASAELVLWRLPKPREGSFHGFKYGLAHVVGGECVLRCDNAVGKGDHRHFRGNEGSYVFTTPEQLVADFQNDIARWNDEHRNA
jgi:hypothetical protein